MKRKKRLSDLDKRVLNVFKTVKRFRGMIFVCKELGIKRESARGGPVQESLKRLAKKGMLEHIQDQGYAPVSENIKTFSSAENRLGRLFNA